jgi:hypothetical protein
MEEEIVMPQRMPHEDGLSIPRIIFEEPLVQEIQQDDEQEEQSTDGEIQTD